MSDWSAVTRAVGDAADLPSVEARFYKGRTFDGSSRPTLTDVQRILDGYEDKLRGALRARGMATTYAAGTEGQRVLGNAAVAATVATIRRDDASESSEGVEGVGAEELAEFVDVLDSIRTGLALFDRELSEDGSTSARSSVRSWITHDVATNTPRIAIGDKSKEIW